jgi:hypothetical protein
MSGLLALQRAMGDLLLEERPAFREDPAAWAATKGLGAGDAEVVQRYAKRLWVYRELVEFALADPLNDGFPIARALLEEAGEWEACLRAFLAARAIPSPYYRDIAPAFVAWLAESGWGAERWPFLLSLAHWERTEMELLRHPDGAGPSPLLAEPAPGLRAVFTEARHLAYPFRVHEATEEAPVPAAGEAYLLAWRDGDDDFQSLALSAHASALVGRLLDNDTLEEAAAAIGVTYAEALPLLEDLRARGVLLGFRTD